MIEKLFKELAWKCCINSLRFEYIPESTGIVVSDRNYRIVANIWMDADNIEGELSWLERQIDAHIRNQQKMTS